MTTEHDFTEARRKAAVQASMDLMTARAELEETAPTDVIERYTAALINAAREKQSPMWGRAPGDIDPNGYIDPDPASDGPRPGGSRPTPDYGAPALPVYGAPGAMKPSDHVHTDRCRVYANHAGTFPCPECSVEYRRCEVSREATGQGTGHCESDYYCPEGHMVG